MTKNKQLTLRQGLENFRKENKDYLNHKKEGISSEAKTFFKSHDVAHVLFGCDISLFGEGSVKIWTIFGTTLGFWKHLAAYKQANAYELSRNFKLAHIVKNMFRFLVKIPTIISRARQMNKRWPWSSFDAYMDSPIVDIREEYNIRVL